MLTDQTSRSHGDSTTLIRGYWSSAVPIEIPTAFVSCFFRGGKKLIQKSKLKVPQPNYQNNFEKEEKKSRRYGTGIYDEWNRIQRPEINTKWCDQVTFDKGAETIWGERPINTRM